MYIFFIACAIAGAVLLGLQIGAALLGADSDIVADADLATGLNLLSVRAIAAGVGAFGLGGLAVLEVGLGSAMALPIGAFLGSGAMLLTALLTRAMLRLEGSGSLKMERAVGRAGTVHLSIPAGAEGAGRIQFELQGRTLEMKAVSSEGPIPTGTAVTIVALVDGETVEVVPTPTLKEIIG
jgi:hypothetical protein